jgi:hypothetical protein
VEAGRRRDAVGRRGDQAVGPRARRSFERSRSYFFRTRGSERQHRTSRRKKQCLTIGSFIGALDTRKRSIC